MSFIPPDLAPLFEAIQREIADEQAAAKAREDPRFVEAMLAALFPPGRVGLLSTLFGQPDRWFHFKQLVRLAGGGVGQAHDTLSQLQQAGVLRTNWYRGRKCFQANPSAPLHAELCAMFRKGTGLASPLRTALAPVEAAIEGAFVHEGFSNSRDGLVRLQVVLVSESPLPGLSELIRVAENQLHRRIDALELSKSDLCDGGYFIDSILARPRVWVIGSEAWLAEVARKV